MPRITKKGQVTIPKEIRDLLGIKPNDIGEFTVSEGNVTFTAKKGTILDCHRIESHEKIDHEQHRRLMEEQSALKISGEIK